MKCELCQKAEAETAIHRKVGAEEQELYVCKACASAGAGPEAGATPEVEQQAAEGCQAVGGVAAFPLMGMILDAAFEIVGRAAVAAGEASCPVCGITRAEYRKASRLGCPACYEAFSEELEAAILDLHRSLQHNGKTPERCQRSRQLAQLERALAEAVQAQRYEEAIALRDQLRRLGGGGAC